MKGKDLQAAIKNSGIMIAELSSSTGIPESTIFKLYKKEVVEGHYLNKIREAGVRLPITTNLPQSPEILERTLMDLSKSIDVITEMFKLIKDDNLHIKKVSNVHLAIIEKADKAGDLILRGRNSK